MTPLIDAHIAHMRAAGKSQNTIEDRARLLRRIDGDLQPHGITGAGTPELEAWLGRDGWAPATRAVYYAHLSSFYRWACHGHRPYLDYNPTEDMQAPRWPDGVPHPCTTAQLAHAIGHARRPYLMAVLLGAYAGMRAGEVATTTREDLLDDEIRILGKGDKVRVVPNHPMIQVEVANLPPGPILIGQYGRPVTADRAATRISEHLTAIGLPDVTQHRFRAWYATQLVRQGVDVRVVQVLMGHANLSMTARYIEVSGEQRRLAVQTLPTLRGGTC